MKRGIVLLSAIGALSFAGMAKATTLYSNGFEPGDPGTADFYDSYTGNQGQNITIVANGGGALHLTAASGTHYAEITNVNDTYQAGYGESVYTDFGAQATGSGVVTGGAFYESTAYYIDTTWAAPANPAVDAFWIDSGPATDPGHLDETNFNVDVTGNGTVGVKFLDSSSSPATVISTSGWYTFKTTFENDGGFVANILSVLDSSGNTLGSYSYVSTLPFADLTGTGYADWTSVWQNGFANNTLGIDDVEVGSLATVPLPASAWSGLALLGGLGLLGAVKRHRRQMA